MKKLLYILVASAMLVAFGCGKQGEQGSTQQQQPSTEQPAQHMESAAGDSAEHPQGAEHPEGEQPAEHPQGQQSSEHPN